MQKTLIFKTNESARLLKIRVYDKRNLLDAVLFKIAALFNLAVERKVYAFIMLIDIYHKLVDLLNSIEAQITEIKIAVKKKLGHKIMLNQPILAKQVIAFNNPISFKLVWVLIRFDRVTAILWYAKNCGLFSHQNHYFRLRMNYKKRLYQLLSKIVHMPLEEIPAVTIGDYLTHHERYVIAADKMGAIEPQALYNALCSSITPTLTPQELNLIGSKLKAKVQDI